MNSRRWQNLHFSKGVPPRFLEKILKVYYPFFFGQMSQKSVDGRSIILQIPYLKQQKHELKKVANFYRGVSPWFLVKNLKFSYPSFFWPNEPIKVLLNVLYRKSLFQNSKNMNLLRRLQNLYLSKGVSPWMFVINLKFRHFFFFGQMSQENVFLNAIFEKTSSRLIEI